MITKFRRDMATLLDSKLSRPVRQTDHSSIQRCGKPDEYHHRMAARICLHRQRQPIVGNPPTLPDGSMTTPVFLVGA